MSSIDELRTQLAALVATARAPWTQDQMAAAPSAWNAYDRVRMTFTIALEASFAAYAGLCAAPAGVEVPAQELKSAVDRTASDVDGVVDVLSRTECDLYRAADGRSGSDASAIETRRQANAQLDAAFQVWRATLLADFEIDQISPGPPGPPNQAPLATNPALVGDPGVTAWLAPMLFKTS